MPSRVRPDTADIEAKRGQALISVIGAQGQPVFGTRGEHAVRLRRAAGNNIVDHHADIGLRTVESEGGSRLQPSARHLSRHNALRRSFFITRRAIDLTRKIQAGNALGFQASRAIRADRRNHIRSHSQGE